MKRINPKGYSAPYKVQIIQDGSKVFKESGSKQKVMQSVNGWFKLK